MRRAPTAVFALCLLAGCSGQSKDPPRVPVYPVEGTLIVSGRLAGNARVIFHAVGKGDGPPLVPVANTTPDGTFRLTTYAFGDGAPAGDYIVTVLWINEAIPIDDCQGIDLQTHDRLCGAYADPATSRLRATVKPERNEITLHAIVGGNGKGWNLPPLSSAGKNDAPR